MQKAYNFVVSWGGLMSIVLSIGTLIADIAGWFQNPNWRFLYLLGFLLLFISYSWLYINHYYGRPRIVVRKYYPRKWTIFTSGLTTTSTTTEGDVQEARQDDYDFAFIEFHNKPKIKTGDSSAKDVIAEISFYNKWGKELLEDVFYARWWEESERGNARTLRKAEIPSSGEIVKLAFASSHTKEDMIFAYGVDSLPKMEWRNERYLLKDKEPIAIVSVKGTNMDDVPLFALQLGLNTDRRMTIKEIELPSWLQSIKAAEQSVHPTAGTGRD